VPFDNFIRDAYQGSLLFRSCISVMPSEVCDHLVSLGICDLFASMLQWKDNDATDGDGVEYVL
jgi:hypothetical protein